MLYLLIMAALGAFFYRLRGAEWGGLFPRPLRQAWFAAVLTAAVAPAALLFGSYWLPHILLAVLGLTTAALTFGHAAYQDLGYFDQYEAAHNKSEFYGVWLDRFMSPGYARDFAGLALSGMLITAPAALAAGLMSPLIGLGVLASGALKPVGYSVGWFVHRRNKRLGKSFIDPLVITEPAAGGLMALGVAIVALPLWT